jgi:hypothetical protein
MIHLNALVVPPTTDPRFLRATETQLKEIKRKMIHLNALGVPPTADPRFLRATENQLKEIKRFLRAGALPKRAIVMPLYITNLCRTFAS